MHYFHVQGQLRNKPKTFFESAKFLHVKTFEGKWESTGIIFMSVVQEWESANTNQDGEEPFCYLGDKVFWDVLVGEVRGLDQLAGERGVGLVKGLPMEP